MPHTIINLYAPNLGQIQFMCKLWKKVLVNRSKQGRTLLCRDFNLAPDPSIDLKGSSPKKHHQSALTPFLHANSLFDIWRCQHSMERDFTFFSKPHCTYFRINLFMGDQQLLQDAIETKIHTITW